MRKELKQLQYWYSAHTPTLLGARHEYAVLCPLIEQSDGLHILFEVRSASVSQSGETCFPGGRMEAGETPVACALRETEEELAIPSSQIRLLGQGDFICNQQGFLLRPIIGVVSAAGLAAMQPSPAEVSEVFTVPMDFFRTVPPERYVYELLPQVPDDFPYEAVGIPRDYPWNRGQVEVPVWLYNGRAIWGMTARLVRELISHV